MTKYGYAFIIAVAALLPVLTVNGPARAEAPAASPYSMDFYGYIEGAKAGDELVVYDKSGKMCGRFALAKDGQYGFVHVYGDDKTTAVDEGAGKDEPLEFKLNGAVLTPLTGGQVSWTGDGQRQRVDFK